MMKSPGLIRFLPAPLLALALSACMTVVDKAGALLEGNYEHTVSRYRSPKSVPAGKGYQVIERAGKSGRGIDIRIESFPAITLKASAPEADGTFYLQSLDYLAGNPSGWVEFSLSLAGEGKLTIRDQSAVLRLKPPLEPLRISRGNIRREETRLSGEDALVVLNNRYERIEALSEWMRKRQAPGPVTENLGDFQAYWKPVLLPELVPAAQRPRHYETGGPARWVTAEQVKWNAAYTELVFPEELRPLRDSGTIKRDWEESSEWIFLVYAWDSIFNTLETSNIAMRKK
jgi:hypothetical protein